MTICLLTLNLFLQHKSCFSMGLISLDTKKYNTFFCVLIMFKVSEIDASGFMEASAKELSILNTK